MPRPHLSDPPNAPSVSIRQVVSLDESEKDVRLLANDTWLNGAAALIQRAGPRVRKGLDRSLRDAGGELPMGTTVQSPGGRLPCSHLVHVVLSDWTSGRRLGGDAFESALLRGLDHAASLGAVTVALDGTDDAWGDLSAEGLFSRVVSALEQHALGPSSIRAVVVAVGEEPGPAIHVEVGTADVLTAGAPDHLQARLLDTLSRAPNDEVSDLVLGITLEWADQLPAPARAEIHAAVHAVERGGSDDPVTSRGRWRRAVAILRRRELRDGLVRPAAAPTELSKAADVPHAMRLARLLHQELTPAGRDLLAKGCLADATGADVAGMTAALLASDDLVTLLTHHLTFARLHELATTSAGTPKNVTQPDECARDVLRDLGFIVAETPRGVSTMAHELAEHRAALQSVSDLGGVTGIATRAGAIGERLLKDLIAFHVRRAFNRQPDEFLRSEGWLAPTYTLERCAFGTIEVIARKVDDRLQNGLELGASRHRELYGDRPLVPFPAGELAGLRNRFAHDRQPMQMVEARDLAQQLLRRIDALVVHVTTPVALLPAVVTVQSTQLDRWGRRSCSVLREDGVRETMPVEDDVRVGRSYFRWHEAERAPYLTLLPVRGAWT